MHFACVMKLFLLEFSAIFLYILNQMFYNMFHIIHASPNNGHTKMTCHMFYESQ